MAKIWTVVWLGLLPHFLQHFIEAFSRTWRRSFSIQIILMMQASHEITNKMEKQLHRIHRHAEKRAGEPSKQFVFHTDKEVHVGNI